MQDIKRGDRIEFAEQESKYDGCKGLVYRVYSDYVVVQLDNAAGTLVSAPWAHIEPLTE